MSLKVSHSKEVTIITITSNPESKWPILCQLLKNLCLSPVCSKHENLKRKIQRQGYARILGVFQIIIGILNIMTGILFAQWGIHDHVMTWNSPFWLGGVFLTSGILTIAATYREGFTRSFCIRVFVAIVNEVCAVLAMIATALYSWDSVNKSYFSHLFNTQKMDGDSYPYKSSMEFHGSLDIVMIVCAFLQLCANVTIVVAVFEEFVVEDPHHN